MEVPKAGGWVKITFFDRSGSLWLGRLTTKNLCPFNTVVRMHDGAVAAEENAVSSTTLVILEVC